MQLSLTGIIFNIQRYAVHDGPGIRLIVFFKGCPLRCWWCHNPEGLQVDPEIVKKNIVLDDQAQLLEEEVVGKSMTVPEVMTEIEKDLLFFDESGGGVTFSGGEPLKQPEFLKTLLKSCKNQEIHTALDTSGYASPEVFQALIDTVDLFLYDLKIMDDLTHRKYTGVSNRMILENLRTLSQRGKPVFIRFPVIPNITDTRKNILDMLAFMADLKTIQQINLLPYHRIAAGKYEKLQKENKMVGVASPSKEHLKALKQEFEQHGFRTKIGG